MHMWQVTRMSLLGGRVWLCKIEGGGTNYVLVTQHDHILCMTLYDTCIGAVAYSTYGTQTINLNQ